MGFCHMLRADDHGVFLDHFSTAGDPTDFVSRTRESECHIFFLGCVKKLGKKVKKIKYFSTNLNTAKNLKKLIF